MPHTVLRVYTYIRRISKIEISCRHSIDNLYICFYIYIPRPLYIWRPTNSTRIYIYVCQRKSCPCPEFKTTLNATRSLIARTHKILTPNNYNYHSPLLHPLHPKKLGLVQDDRWSALKATRPLVSDTCGRCPALWVLCAITVGNDLHSY